jgi:hypothetical protein
MSDAEMELKREEDERLDTAEDPNEEVRYRARHPTSNPHWLPLEHLAWLSRHEILPNYVVLQQAKKASACVQRTDNATGRHRGHAPTRNRDGGRGSQAP